MKPEPPPTRPYGTSCAAAHAAARERRAGKEWGLRKAYQWLVALFAGVATGALAFSLNWATEALSWAKITAAHAYVQSGGGFWVPWAVLCSISVAYSLVAAILVAYFAPGAAGSGIPAMRSWINGTDVPSCVSKRMLAIKALGVSLAIASGLVAGKEGPYIQCGGIIGYLAGCSADAVVKRWALCRNTNSSSPPNSSSNSRSRPKPESRLRRRLRAARASALRALAVVEPREASDFASVGTSAGVAAAFNAPLAGVAYAVEEGNTVFSVAMLWRAVFAAGGAMLVLQLLTYASALGPKLPSANITLTNNLSIQPVGIVGGLFWYHSWEIPLMVLVMGTASGLLGAFWTALCTRLLNFRARYIPERRPALRVLEVVVVAAFTATVRILWAAGQVWISICYLSPCAPLPPGAPRVAALQSESQEQHIMGGHSAAKMWPPLWCEPGQFSPWGQLFAMPIESSVRMLMSIQPLSSRTLVGPEAFAFALPALALFAICIFFGLLLTYGIAAPTGIFIPTMTLGAALGRLAGRGVQAAVIEAGFESLRVSLPAWAAVGASAMLAGNTRLLLATILIVTGTTGSNPAIVPMILAAVVSKLVADSINESVYDFQVAQAGLLFLEDKALLPRERLSTLLSAKVGDALPSTPLAALPPHPTLREALKWLLQHPHSTIPVVRPCSDTFPPSVQSKNTHSKEDTHSSEKHCSSSSSSGVGPGRLLGIVYRWQLLSCLRHVRLLALLLQPCNDSAGSSNANGSDQKTEAARSTAGGGGGGGAKQRFVAAAAGTGEVVVLLGGSGDEMPDGLPAAAAEEKEGKGPSAEPLDPQGFGMTGVNGGSSSSSTDDDASLALLLTLLEQGPPNMAPAAARAAEAKLIRGYLGHAQSEAGAARTSEAAVTTTEPSDIESARDRDVAGSQTDRGQQAIDSAAAAEPPAAAETVPAAAEEEEAAAAAAAAAEREVLLERRLDLSPLFQSVQYTLPPNAPLEAAFDLMRNLGAHSVAVEGEDGVFLGCVTRSRVLAIAEGDCEGGKGGKESHKKNS